MQMKLSNEFISLDSKEAKKFNRMSFGHFMAAKDDESESECCFKDRRVQVISIIFLLILVAIGVRFLFVSQQPEGKFFPKSSSILQYLHKTLGLRIF